MAPNAVRVMPTDPAVLEWAKQQELKTEQEVKPTAVRVMPTDPAVLEWVEQQKRRREQVEPTAVRVMPRPVQRQPSRKDFLREWYYRNVESRDQVKKRRRRAAVDKNKPRTPQRSVFGRLW